MAKKKDDYKGYDISTRAVHTGNGYDEGTGAIISNDLDQALRAVGL